MKCTMLCECVCIYACMYACIYVYMYVSTYVRMYVCMYVCIRNIKLMCLIILFVLKVLSRAFRNRFVELHFDDIPAEELVTILYRRCKLPESYAKKLVAVMKELQVDFHFKPTSICY